MNGLKRIGLGGLMTGLLMWASAVGPAQAVVNPRGVAHDLAAGVVSLHELGTMQIGGSRVLCLDESGGVFGYVAAPDYLTTPEPVEHWQASYALWRWLGSDDDQVAASLYLLIGVDLGLNSNPAEATAAFAAAAQLPGLSGLPDVRAHMLQATRANAGPYQAGALSPVSDDDLGRSGLVTGVGVLSAAGLWQAGFAAQLSLSDADDPSGPAPAVFEATGSPVYDFTTGSGPDPVDDGFAWRAVADGRVRVTLTVTGLPRHILRYPAPAPHQQRLVARAALTDLSFQGDPEPVRSTYSPQIATTVAAALVGPGQPLADNFVVLGGRPGSTQTGQAELYGPFPEQPDATTAAGAPVATLPLQLTYDQTGQASGRTEPVELSPTAGPGYYTWVFRLAPDGLNQAAVSLFGEVAETTLLADPSLTSQISDQLAWPGQTISDSVLISGLVQALPDGRPLTASLSGRLVRTAAQSDPAGQPTCQGADWSAAQLVAEIPAQELPLAAAGPQIDLTGLGSYTVPAGAALGCYSYGETLTLSTAEGDLSLEIDHPTGRVNQTSLVLQPGGVIRAGDGSSPARRLLAVLPGVGLAALLVALWSNRRRSDRPAAGATSALDRP
ncbi:MAG: hypothetical protein LBK54_06530 [Propionibacteriaceae bacterium]|jgi:hypothetical protein|nr:hypothetical protein [Propionibacteriaceae bacterium]